MKRREFVKSLTAVGTGLLLPPGAAHFLQAQEAQADQAVKRVLVMFKCHFDAGFVDTQSNVVHKYFNEYFPQAIETARAQNAQGKRRYVWSTGSWLLYEYLEQASPAQRRTMEEAIARGDIAWHALPFTWWSEMLNQSLIEGGLGISQALDRRFGMVTTGAKMTDVPGHTRGLIPPLTKHGVNFLDIGMNPAPPFPRVPQLFLWKDPSGASLPVAYHRDYGGSVRVPGSELVAAACVRGDNSGPHTAKEIDEVHAGYAKRFPNAEIRACNLTEIGEAIKPYGDKLPVVTEEIGDTWIYGPPSDPLKVARYREVARLRDGWIGGGVFQCGDATDLALLRHMLLDAEHTGGADTKVWLDYDHYKPADLARMLDTKGYKVVAFSWEEKRQDLLDGVATLPAKLRAEAESAIKSLNAVEPQVSATSVEHPAGAPIETAHYILAFDAKTGAILRLRNKATGREWASPGNPIALFTYQTLSQEDYRRYIGSYVQIKEDWVYHDFGKPNIEKFGAVSRDWHPDSAIVHVEETETAHRIVVRLKIEDEAAFQSGIAAFPRKVFYELMLPKDEAAIHLTVSCFEKPATRLPESLWLTFNPIAEDRNGWTLDKTDETISPFEVVANGNRHMHGLWKGFEYSKAGNRFAVETIDAPVVALGKDRSPLVFSNDQPDLSKGVHSNLYNNAWGCNFISWYSEDMRFRYVIRA
jgi:hypothetical protein